MAKSPTRRKKRKKSRGAKRNGAPASLTARSRAFRSELKQAKRERSSASQRWIGVVLALAALGVTVLLLTQT